MSADIETECAHCHAPLHLNIDHALNFQVRETNAAPMAFMPIVDFDRLKGPSIIDAF